MSDEDILKGLRAAALEDRAKGAPAPFDAPIDEVALARMTRAVSSERAKASRRRPVAIGGVAAALVAAAAAFVVLRSPRPPTSFDLPRYEVEVSGGEDASRGGAASASQPLRARAHASLRLALRPAVDVAAPLHVELASLRAGAVGDAHAEIKVSATGAIELRGTTAELVGATPGPATLVVVIAPTTTSIDAKAIARGAPAPSGATVVREEVSVLAP